MGNVPKPRKAGQTGGGGRINQSGNRNASRARGGSPTRGGGNANDKSCLVMAIALAAGVGTVLSLSAWGAVEAARALL